MASRSATALSPAPSARCRGGLTIRSRWKRRRAGAASGRAAAVPDEVIAALKARERGGLIELPKPPRFRPGDKVRVLYGPLIGVTGLYAGMRPRERVEVLL